MRAGARDFAGRFEGQSVFGQRSGRRAWVMVQGIRSAGSPSGSREADPSPWGRIPPERLFRLGLASAQQHLASDPPALDFKGLTRAGGDSGADSGVGSRVQRSWARPGRLRACGHSTHRQRPTTPTPLARYPCNDYPPPA